MVKRMISKNQFSRGFTLIELLVVISVIGTLATLILLQLGTARAKARDAKRIADVAQLRTAIELYFDDNGGRYPTAMTIANLGSYFSAPALPNDPLTGNAYRYAYSPATNPNRFQVWTDLERPNTPAFSADADINSTGWSGSTVNGATESTTSCSGSNDCIYDLGQR